MSSMPTDTRTRSSVIPICLAPLRWHRRMGHGRRVADQRLDAAKAFGQRHQPDVVQQRARPLERPQRERDQAAEPAHLPLSPSACCGCVVSPG